MVTARFCSSKCCNQAYRYKRNVQSGKCTPPDSTIDLSTLSRRVDEKKHFNDTLKDKQFLSPTEAAELLGVCRSTVYNYLGLQELKAKQFRGKTIIRRSDIEKLFDEAPSYKKRGSIPKGKKTHNDYYSLKEMMEKFKISKRTVFRRCEQFGIPQIIEGRRTFWKKTDVDVHFAELLVQYDLKDWYNAQQIEDIYGMKRATLNQYALRHNVPRIQFQNITYYSKSHIDNLKRLAKIPDSNYYTVQDIVKISALRDENKLLRNNNEQSAALNEKAHKEIDDLRKENIDLKRKAYPERYVLPSFIDVEATHAYKDKQGQCHITMKFIGGSKEYKEKMSNEDFVAFKNGSLTKEEVIAKYHKTRIEAYIRREFFSPVILQTHSAKSARHIAR